MKGDLGAAVRETAANAQTDTENVRLATRHHDNNLTTGQRVFWLVFVVLYALVLFTVEAPGVR